MAIFCSFQNIGSEGGNSAWMNNVFLLFLRSLACGTSFAHTYGKPAVAFSPSANCSRTFWRKLRHWQKKAYKVQFSMQVQIWINAIFTQKYSPLSCNQFEMRTRIDSQFGISGFLCTRLFEIRLSQMHLHGKKVVRP